MGKRATNTAAAKAAAKKPKLDPALASVADVVKNAGHLPDRCRSMLIDLLPFSLAVESDVRSESQTVVVGMMEETLMAVKATMEAEVTTEKLKQQLIEAALVEREHAVEEANVALNTQVEATEAAKAALDDATRAMNDSKQALSEKQEIQKAGDTKLTTTRTNKDALEAAFKEHYHTPTEKSEAPNYNGLEPFLSQLDIEQSLLTALPGTCAKDKTSRGNFDEVVLTEFEKAMNAKITSLKETIETEIPASSGREEQVKLAEADLNAKKEEHGLALDALAAARQKLSELEIFFKSAKGSVNEFQRQLTSTTSLREAAQANVKFFETTPLTEFMALKSKTATPVEAAPAGA